MNVNREPVSRSPQVVGGPVGPTPDNGSASLNNQSRALIVSPVGMELSFEVIRRRRPVVETGDAPTRVSHDHALGGIDASVNKRGAPAKVHDHPLGMGIAGKPSPDDIPVFSFIDHKGPDDEDDTIPEVVPAGPAPESPANSDPDDDSIIGF